MIVDDLAGLSEQNSREAIEVALDETGTPIRVSARGGSLLIAGMSGGGKSTVATGLLERIQARSFQFCVVDPEGDYAEFENAVTLGDAKHEPRLEEAIELLRHVKENLVVNLLGVQLDERPRYFAKLFLQLCQLRAETARPHWILIDECRPNGQQPVPCHSWCKERSSSPSIPNMSRVRRSRLLVLSSPSAGIPLQRFACCAAR
jgi:hypothetical protein